MTVVPGQYALRISRRNAMSGVYATGNGVDKVVTTAAAVPSTVDAQIVSNPLCASSVRSKLIVRACH